MCIFSLVKRQEADGECWTLKQGGTDITRCVLFEPASDMAGDVLWFFPLVFFPGVYQLWQYRIEMWCDDVLDFIMTGQRTDTITIVLLWTIKRMHWTFSCTISSCWKFISMSQPGPSLLQQNVLCGICKWRLYQHYPSHRLHDDAIWVYICVQVWRPCCTWRAWSWRTGTASLLRQRDIRRGNQFPDWWSWWERYHHFLPIILLQFYCVNYRPELLLPFPSSCFCVRRASLALGRTSSRGPTPSQSTRKSSET